MSKQRPRRLRWDRIALGLLAGLSWMLAVESFYGYTLAAAGSRAAAGRFLAVAGWALGCCTFFVISDLLLARTNDRPKRPAAEPPSPVLSNALVPERKR